MIIIHTKNGSLTLENSDNVGKHIPDSPCWIDLTNPSDSEEKAVESLLSINIPTRAELRKNEAMNRFFEDNSAIFLSSGLMSNSETSEPSFDVVTFIITGNHLVTCRYNKPRSFDNFISWLSRHPEGFSSSDVLFAGLLYSICLRSAEILEKMSDTLEDLSNQVFSKNNLSGELDLRAALKNLGRNGTITIRLKESMDSLTRMATYYLAHRKNTISQQAQASLSRTLDELSSLNSHMNFLASEVNFLVNTTISLITVQQNTIIKIFSVAAAAFLPPTLIASIYGMNFQHMPELSSQFGYPLAVAAMLASAVIPIMYFKRKGWL